jgi:hypothetical protein
MAKPSDNSRLVRTAGTLPLNMYREDRVTEPSPADMGDQLSEYDSDSSADEDSATHEEYAV